MNEEGCLHNITPPTSSCSKLDEALAVTPGRGANQWKGKPSKFTPAVLKKPSQIVCHECREVGHICSVCPTQDSDAMVNVAFENDEETNLTATDEDEDDGAW